MSFRFDATSDFFQSVKEVHKLLDLALSDDENHALFLKLAAVSVVTKFQVYIESVLSEFRYALNGKTSKTLPTYLKMNSLRISIENSNPLTGLMKHCNFTDEKKEKIVQYLSSISYISDNDKEIDTDLLFNTKFPLGSTGKTELVDLLKQIDGNQNPFESFADDFDQLDSILQTRHLIIHQDRFTGTYTTVNVNVNYIEKLVVYVDTYLQNKLTQIEQQNT